MHDPASRVPLPAALAADLGACLRFYGRLAVPPLSRADDPGAAPDFRRVPRMLPVAGLVLALPGCAVLALALALGLGGFVAGALAVAATALATGGLHEDGLADVADGFLGGATPERRLAIMRDSRIGAYGALALGLALLLRVGALAEIASRAGAPATCGAFAVAAILSRTATLVPLAALAPARPDGAGRAVGRPTGRTHALAWGLAALLALAAARLAGLPPAGALLGFLLAGGAGLALAALARRLIGGQTGDVAGAAQQVAEVGALLGVLAALGPASA